MPQNDYGVAALQAMCFQAHIPWVDGRAELQGLRPAVDNRGLSRREWLQDAPQPNWMSSVDVRHLQVGPLHQQSQDP